MYAAGVAVRVAADRCAPRPISPRWADGRRSGARAARPGPPAVPSGRTRGPRSAADCGALRGGLPALQAASRRGVAAGIVGHGAAAAHRTLLRPQLIRSQE